MSRNQTDAAGAAAGWATGAAVGGAAAGPIGAFFGGVIGGAIGFVVADDAWQVGHNHPEPHLPKNKPQTPDEPPVEPEPDPDPDPDPYDPCTVPHNWHMCLNRMNELPRRYGRLGSDKPFGKYSHLQFKQVQAELRNYLHFMQRHPVATTGSAIGIILNYTKSLRGHYLSKLRDTFRQFGLFTEAIFDDARLVGSAIDRAIHTMTPRSRRWNYSGRAIELSPDDPSYQQVVNMFRRPSPWAAGPRQHTLRGMFHEYVVAPFMEGYRGRPGVRRRLF